MRTPDISAIQKFYDKFSIRYDAERESSAYSIINLLELEKVIPLAQSKVVLEIGCGTGLILQEIDKSAQFAYGVDISAAMLKKANARGLKIVQASANNLPFKTDVFDIVYSFKTLPHVPDIKSAIKEMTAITKHGGYLILEFYNPYGWAGAVSNVLGKLIPYMGPKVYQRFDSYKNIKSYLPKDVAIKSLRGIKIFTPHHVLYKIPILSSLFKCLDRTFCNSLLAVFGDYLVIVLRRK